MKRIILIMLMTLILVGAASAAQIDVNVTTSQAWITANNRDEVDVTVTVIDSAGENAGKPFVGANISYSVNSPYKLKDTHDISDEDGIRLTTLEDTKVSGIANVTVQVDALKLTELFGWVNYTEIRQVGIPIDHYTPWSIATIYKSQVQVRTPVPISVYVKDYYGNPVDNRRVVETVKFDASSSGIAGFESGGSWVKSLTVPVNESGYANVQFRADLGLNTVMITPPSPIWYKLITIEGTSTSVPTRVTSVVSPDGNPYPYTTVKDGSFTIGYTFTDQYGYPVLNQPVNITTSAKETMSYNTNMAGMVVITYGPKDIAGIYEISATAVNNASVTDTQKVEFISGEATDALLTASPQTMASRDVKDDIISTLTMRVMDQKGNPVEGEIVIFRFKSIHVPGVYNQTTLPILEAGGMSTSFTNVDITAISDEDGNARATFHPGGFTTDPKAPKYNVSAEGRAYVEAQWSNVKRQMTLKYINYRYLTIESRVNPLIVRVNETVDLTVTVRGDGYALQPKPADVILVTDRSGSMLYNDPPDRMVSVKSASQFFRTQLDYSRDRLGMVSFSKAATADPKSDSKCGDDDNNPIDDDDSYALLNYNSAKSKTYGADATLDLPLSSNPMTIRKAIDGLVPNGNTAMRYGLKLAIDEMRKNGSANPDTVKALILLSDGDYNWYGDPLARGGAGSSTPSSYGGPPDYAYYRFSDITNNSQQNLAAYAAFYKIRVFTIAFAQGSGMTPGKETLDLIARQTGGKYYDAPTADMLAGIYTDIAGSLRDEAGVNTLMNLSFDNVQVNNVAMPGEQAYEYKRIAGHSTFVNSWNETVNPLPGYPKEYDSTADWNDQQFDFFIGTVRLGQTWESTVTLKVLAEGNINVFDASNSAISVDNGGVTRLNIPEIYITALPNSSETGLHGAAHLQVKDLTLTNTGSKTSADLRWNFVYDGTESIVEDIMMAPFATEDWYHLPLKLVPKTTITDTASMPINGLPYGYYTIRVEGNAYDANEAFDTLYILISDAGVSVPTEPPVPGPIGASKPKIKIS